MQYAERIYEILLPCFSSSVLASNNLPNDILEIYELNTLACMHMDDEKEFIARRLSRALLSLHKSRIKATEENENVNSASFGWGYS
jgi:hypothetical protein